MATDYHLAAAQREEQFAQQQRDFEHELRTDLRYQPYLAGYAPASVEGFIKHYAAHKVNCLRNGPEMVKFRLHRAIEYQEATYKRLFDIQQKKLFDLQVRWRAGEITLPGVAVCQQFMSWERHVHACPWLLPITRAEYDLYRDYLASPVCQDVGHHPDHSRPHDWQGYDHMHDDWRRTQPNPPADEPYDSTPYPAWYAYYDARTGAPAGYPFATHPNHKGEREQYYRGLAIAEERAAHGPPAPYVPDPRPFYYHFDDTESFESPPGWYVDKYTQQFEAFARAFDPDPEPLATYYRAWLRLQNSTYSRYMQLTESSRELLWDAGGPWPVAAHPDWRQGLVAAAQELHRALLLAALPAVFDDYEFRLATGLAPAAPDEHRAYHDARRRPRPGLRRACLPGAPHSARPRASRRTPGF